MYFPASSVVKTCTSKAGGVGSIPGQGTRSYMPCGAARKKKPFDVLFAANIF